MKLSIWTLDFWLKEHSFETEAEISDGSPVISGLRFGVSETGRLSLMSSDREGRGSVLSCGSDRIYLRSPDRAAIINSVSSCFEFYSQWEAELLDCVLHKKPIREMLDIAHRVFRRPMFIKNENDWVFAITDGYSTDVHPDWEALTESMNGKSHTFNSVLTLSMDPKYQTAYVQASPVVVNSPINGRPVLRSNIRLDGKRVCEIVAIEYNRPFDPGEIHLMGFFSQLIELYISNNKSLYFTVSGISGFLSKLLNGDKYSEDELRTVWSATGWNREDEFLSIFIEAMSGTDTPLSSVIRPKLEEWFRHCGTLEWSGGVVCLINLSKTGEFSDIMEALSSSIPQDAFVWGASHEFSGIENFADYCRQAVFAKELALRRGMGHLDMRSAAYSCLSERLRSESWLKTLVHPDLIRLMRHDRQNHTEYLKTLREYLLCGGNYTDTAIRLNLHRNTLIYRINRIRELISDNIQDPESRGLLLASYLLLEN